MFKWLKDLFLDKEPHPEKYEQLRQQPKPTVQRATTRSKTMATKQGLYANIAAKKERIVKEKAEGKPIERMRKVGTKGAPTAKAFKESANNAKK